MMLECRGDGAECLRSPTHVARGTLPTGAGVGKCPAAAPAREPRCLTVAQKRVAHARHHELHRDRGQQQAHDARHDADARLSEPDHQALA